MGAKVRPEVVKTIRVGNRGKPVVRSCVCKSKLLEQERRNCKGKLESVPGSGRFHVHVGGKRAIEWLEPLHRWIEPMQPICTLGTRNDGGHGEREA